RRNRRKALISREKTASVRAPVPRTKRRWPAQPTHNRRTRTPRKQAFAPVATVATVKSLPLRVPYLTTRLVAIVSETTVSGASVIQDRARAHEKGSKRYVPGPLDVLGRIDGRSLDSTRRVRKGLRRPSGASLNVQPAS